MDNRDGWQEKLKRISTWRGRWWSFCSFTLHSSRLIQLDFYCSFYVTFISADTAWFLLLLLRYIRLGWYSLISTAPFTLHSSRLIQLDFYCSFYVTFVSADTAWFLLLLLRYIRLGWYSLISTAPFTLHSSRLIQLDFYCSFYVTFVSADTAWFLLLLLRYIHLGWYSLISTAPFFSCCRWSCPRLRYIHILLWSQNHLKSYWYHANDALK